MQLLVMPMAMWLLPVPVPPTATTLRCWERKLPPARSRTSCSLIVDAVLALDAGGDDLVIGGPHAGELQGRHHLQDLRAIHGPPPSRPHRRRGDWAVVATHRSERNRREAEPAVAIAPVWQWARPEQDRCAAPGCSGSHRHCMRLSQAPQRMLLLQRPAHPTPLT